MTIRMQYKLILKQFEYKTRKAYSYYKDGGRDLEEKVDKRVGRKGAAGAWRMEDSFLIYFYELSNLNVLSSL